MGLGPSVCLHCELALVLDDNHQWHCPKCGETDYIDYLWMFTEAEQQRIQNNTKFYRFVSGVE
jgi:hypothetical protein